MGRNGCAPEWRENMSLDLDCAARLDLDAVSLCYTEPHRQECFTQISEEPPKRGNSREYETEQEARDKAEQLAMNEQK